MLKRVLLNSRLSHSSIAALVPAIPRSFTHGTPRRLIGQHRLDSSPFRVGGFVAADSPLLRLGGLNHGLEAKFNEPRANSRLGRDAPESGLVVLNMSSSACDP